MPYSNNLQHETEKLQIVVYSSAAASHLGFISLPHFFGSSLCIFSICLATSGCFSMTCLVMAFTMPSQVSADNCWSHFPPSSRQVRVFIGHSSQAFSESLPSSNLQDRFGVAAST